MPGRLSDQPMTLPGAPPQASASAANSPTAIRRRMRIRSILQKRSGRPSAPPCLAGDLIPEEHPARELQLAREREPVLLRHADGGDVLRADDGHQLRLAAGEAFVAHPPRRLAGDALPPRVRN